MMNERVVPISNRGYRPSKSQKRVQWKRVAKTRRLRDAARRSAISPKCHRCALHVLALFTLLCSLSILCGNFWSQVITFCCSVLSSRPRCLTQLHRFTFDTTQVLRHVIKPQQIGRRQIPHRALDTESYHSSMRSVSVWLFLHAVLASIRSQYYSVTLFIKFLFIRS